MTLWVGWLRSVDARAAGKAAQRVDHPAGIGRHVGIDADDVLFVTEGRRSKFRHSVIAPGKVHDV
jgi:hypothetical protein